MFLSHIQSQENSKMNSSAYFLVSSEISDDLWSSANKLSSPYYFQLHFILHLQDARQDLNCQHFIRGEGKKVSPTQNLYLHIQKTVFLRFQCNPPKWGGQISTWSFFCLSDQGLQTTAIHHFVINLIQIKLWLILVYCFLEAYWGYFLMTNQVYLIAGKHFRVLIYQLIGTWKRGTMASLSNFQSTTIIN